MKKIIRLNESDLRRIVNRVIRETTNTKRGRRLNEVLEGDEGVTLGEITINDGMKGKWEVGSNNLYVTLDYNTERSIDSMGNPASSITNDNYDTSDMLYNVVCSKEDARTGPLRDFPSSEERYLNDTGKSAYPDQERYSLGDVRELFNGSKGTYEVKHTTLLLTENGKPNDVIHVFCDEVDAQSYR